MKSLHLSLLPFLGMIGFAWSQQATPAPTPTPTPEEPKRACWMADLPGGRYVVALDTITSISQSQYIVDGNARVTEVTVDTTGNVQGRFYYVEPYVPQSPLMSGQAEIDKLKDKAEEVLGRVSEDDPNTLVMKNYPTSTHAHTVEFRVNSKAALKKLYSSLESAFRNQRDTKFK